MSDKSFNLLYEPWICVMHNDGRVGEVSILDAFRDAEKYRALSGELPTQDVAVLRLLLAILHAVFGRWDVNGEEEPLCDLDSESILDRWDSIWKMGHFPMDVIASYLKTYEERFYLFHPHTPFYQVPDLKIGTDYDTPKLNGTISESGNKIRLFSQRSGADKQFLTYAEAARWLLYVNAYDDTSAKPTRGKDHLPSPGAGWLGKLGLIFASGDNLFETLVLNLVLLKNGGHETWGPEKPIWEREVQKGERIKIAQPDNLSELYTIQSRRLLLKRSQDKVTGYTLLGGDFFEKENMFNEPMTTWRNTAKKATDAPCYVPARHSPQRQIWRDLSSIVAMQVGRRPEIVNWLETVSKSVGKSVFCFQTPAVSYGDKDSSVDDVFNDSISFNSALLSKVGEEWIDKILEALRNSDALVFCLGVLAKNIKLAEGADKEGKTPDGEKAAWEMRAYYELDGLFRGWLNRIDPLKDSKEEVCEKWWKTSQTVVRKLAGEMVAQAGPKAFIGRDVKINNQDKRITSVDAYNLFLYKTSSKEALKKKSGDKK